MGKIVGGIMSKVKKRMRIAATIMAVALSATMITTNMIPVAEVPVQAVEDENTYSKVADSKIEGFYYEKNGYGNRRCLSMSAKLIGAPDWVIQPDSPELSGQEGHCRILAQINTKLI